MRNLWRRYGMRIDGRRIVALAAALAATGACEFGADDSGGGGCGGTPGVLGNVTFNFEHAGTEDLSDPSGNAFAAGTLETAGFSMNDGSVAPASIAESSDPAIFSVDEGGTADHPLRLAFQRPGIATLRVLQSADRSVLDEVNLRVAEPRALRLSAGHVHSPSFDGAGLVGEPERIVLLPGAQCRLYSYLTDGTELILYGTFSTTVTGATIASFADEGMVPLSLIGAAVHSAQRVTAVSEGSETVTVAGPGGLQRQVRIDVEAAPVVERLELALWPGYVTEWKAGETTVASVYGRTADGAPVYGAPVTFASGDATVVAVRADTGEPDSASLDFLRVGSATITVRLVADPSVSSEFDVTVVAPDAED